MQQSHDRPRIEPIPEADWDDEERALVKRSWSQPPPDTVNPLYPTMVRHREIFRTWHEFGRAVFQGTLPYRERQLIILRTAWLNRCRFEWAYHEPIARRFELTAEEVARVTEGPEASGWSESEAGLLRAVDELYEVSDLTDDTWQALRSRYNDQELIEVLMLVGEYTLVAYFTNALRIAPRQGLTPFPAGRQ